MLGNAWDLSYHQARLSVGAHSHGRADDVRAAETLWHMLLRPRLPADLTKAVEGRDLQKDLQRIAKFMFAARCSDIPAHASPAGCRSKCVRTCASLMWMTAYKVVKPMLWRPQSCFL